MPSWNIHTAHVERLLADTPPSDLGIGDANAFLFANYIPDIYVGYMVPDATMHIDYRITHVTPAYMIPIPDADKFWDNYMLRFRPPTAAETSLLLGAWAHLTTDRIYNGRFRNHCVEYGREADEGLRVRKQGDFSLFGRSLGISAHVQATPELLEAAWKFRPYRILADDVHRAIAAADAIVAGNPGPTEHAKSDYQEIDAAWMTSVFEACNERLRTWLLTWQELEARGEDIHAAEIRVAAGIPPATPDDPEWLRKVG